MRKGLLILFIALAPQAIAAQDRVDTEARLEEVKKAIAQLQETLENERTRQVRGQRSLKKLDLDIQAHARRLRDLQAKRGEQERLIAGLRARQRARLAELGIKEAQLEEQVLAAWMFSRESRLKLILNQDSPARLARLMKYYEYFGSAQARSITDLRASVDALEDTRADVERELATLSKLERREQAASMELEARRSEQMRMLHGLSAEIADNEARLTELNRNRADLEALLETLADALSDIPHDLGEHLHPGALRGRLPMPVDGRVLRGFGQPRGAGLHWQGWLIEAREGEPVRSIAYGRVAYADWLRGYGLLLIVDHGRGFMSLYGYNESLLFDVGDWIQPGEVLATAGRNPGTGQGLYFELRNHGKAVDPAAWIDRS